MKEQHLTFSFLVSGHVMQEVVITDDDYTPEQVVKLLNTNGVLTSLQEDGDLLLLADGTFKVIGKVIASDPDADYFDFEEVESWEVETETTKPFDMTRLSTAGAIGEFIYEPDMSCDEILVRLIDAGDEVPDLTLEELYQDKSAKYLLNEIQLMKKGLESLMKAAYDAGVAGKEIV